MFGGVPAGGAPPKPAGEQPAADRPPSAIRYARSVETNACQTAIGNLSVLGRPGSLLRREYLEIKLTGPGGLDRTIERTLYEAEDGNDRSPVIHECSVPGAPC